MVNLRTFGVCVDFQCDEKCEQQMLHFFWRQNLLQHIITVLCDIQKYACSGKIDKNNENFKYYSEGMRIQTNTHTKFARNKS